MTPESGQPGLWDGGAVPEPEQQFTELTAELLTTTAGPVVINVTDGGQVHVHVGAAAAELEAVLGKLDQLVQAQGQFRAAVTRWAREDRALEQQAMGTLDDLRAAQGNVAGAVAAIGAEATAAADRIVNAIAALQAQVQAGSQNTVSPADVQALTDTEVRLRAIGTQIAALGADPGSEVPPPGDVPPLDDLPPVTEQPGDPGQPDQPPPDEGQPEPPPEQPDEPQTRRGRR